MNKKLKHERILPYHEKFSIKKNWWSRYHKYYSKEGLSFYKRLDFLLNNNIGKSFDMTFSYFCKKFPKELQFEFLNEFSNSKRHRDWYVDDDGNIQKVKQKPKKYYIPNPNSKVRYRHIYTNQVTFRKDKVYITNHRNWIEELTEPAFFEVNKSSIEFKTFVKKENSERKRKERLQKQEDKVRSERIFNESISRSKQLLQMQKELDILKRNQHGFDENSFIGKPYHGRKNKG